MDLYHEALNNLFEDYPDFFEILEQIEPNQNESNSVGLDEQIVTDPIDIQLVDEPNEFNFEFEDVNLEELNQYGGSLSYEIENVSNGINNRFNCTERTYNIYASFYGLVQ